MTTIIKAGLDIGNGYVKGLIAGDGGITTVDIPSGVALMTRQNPIPTPDAQAKEELSDVFNVLDASFVSPMIADNYRRLFGNRSLNAGGSFQEFDVLGSLSKAQQPLSKMLVLGCIAGKVLKDYVDKTNGLPPVGTHLKADVYCGLALPITEYMQHRVTYANEFLSSVHTVVIHNFETPVSVTLTFKKVEVIAEGASAQYAIVAKGEPLMNIMLQDVRKHGVALEGITANDVLRAQDTLGIDIGEGTVNFPVFSNGRFNTDASMTLNKGYGSVLANALQAMQEQGFNGGFSSRKQLASYLQHEPSPLKRAHYERVKRFVDNEIEFFAREVAEKLGHVLTRVGASTEVIYVYGGGAGAVKEMLYPELLKKVQEILGVSEFAVLYLDSRYSRHLNREGLFIVADKISLRK